MGPRERSGLREKGVVLMVGPTCESATEYGSLAMT